MNQKSIMLPLELFDVPCFICLVDKRVSWYYCKPETCPIMDDWLDDVSWDKYFKTEVPLWCIMSHLSFEGQSAVSYCLEKPGQIALAR